MASIFCFDLEDYVPEAQKVGAGGPAALLIQVSPRSELLDETERGARRGSCATGEAGGEE